VLAENAHVDRVDAFDDDPNRIALQSGVRAIPTAQGQVARARRSLRRQPAPTGATRSRSADRGGAVARCDHVPARERPERRTACEREGRVVVHGPSDACAMLTLQRRTPPLGDKPMGLVRSPVAR